MSKEQENHFTTGRGTRGLVRREPLLFEQGEEGRCGYSFGADDFPAAEGGWPAELVRHEIKNLPELSEVEVVRHFTRLSQYNFGVDTAMYPLGSCTMKYNPKINERVARLPGFAGLHPYTPEKYAQSALRLMAELEQQLCEISGLAEVTLQPAAGAHGEFTGLKIIRAYLTEHGGPRTTVLVPDSAHGTNPASSALNGYQVRQIKSGPAGHVVTAAVAAALDANVACLMLTNPNTLGIFEREIQGIAEILHRAGALLYCDGANLNALMGISRPGDMGVDVMQFNLHKTFSTPHGGGGPGAGPVGVVRQLAPYLPVPRIGRRGAAYFLDWDRPQSVGQTKAFYGHFGVMVRAYTYIRELGAAGLKRATELAVLNANYLKARLREHYALPFDQPSFHEVVFDDRRLKEYGVTTMDVAKRLIDYGFHPPTVYFPIHVHGAIMIEPTESESPESLDEFADALIAIAEEARRNPQLLTEAPHNSYLRRLDEVSAARHPCLCWGAGGDDAED